MMRRVSTAAAMLLASSAANAEWVKASSKHFVVYSDDKPEAVRNYTTKLERFDAAVRIALGLKTIEVSPAARVQVFILPSIDDVQRLSRIGGDVAGFYNDNSPMDIYAFVPRRASGDGTEKSLTPQQVLFHEYTHHIMYSSFDGVAIPTWFSEGFAEMFATARIDSEGNVTFGQLPLYRTYGIDMDNVVPAERLVRQGPDYHDSLQTQVFYGRSWLLTDYLMFDHERSKQLAAYIIAINSGQSGDQAAKILGVNSTFDLKLNSYGSRSQWPAVTIPADKLAVGDVTVAPLSAGEAAIMPALIRSRNGVDEKQAQTVLAEARRLAAPYPNDPAVQNEMAEAEYDAGDYGASEAAADRALAADPKSIHALIYKGNAQIALLKKASSKDATAWTTARRYFLAANRLDPIYSYPPELYYESFGAEGVKPTPAAINGLLYAYKLRPDLKSLRFEAALAMLRMGNKQGAQVALEPIAYSPHAGSGADLSRKVLDALNKEGTDAALTVLDTAQRDEKKKKPA